jgi:HEAT repeat protein
MPDHLPLLLSGLSPALEPILFQIAEAGVVKLLGLGRQEKAHACVQALLSSLGQSEDADMRAACIASLAWLLTLLQQHAVTIAAGLDDPEEVVRLATTAAINRVHGQQPGVALDIYLGRFNHAQAHTRISAVRAASGLVKGHPGLLASLLPHLLEVVGKDETDVSQCAMEAVSNVMTSIEADRLLMDITSGQSHHRLVTLSARLLFKHQELTAAYHSRFLAWLGDGDADVRLAAVRSLKSVNGNEGRDESIRGLLLRLQQDTDSRVQMAALDALSVYLSAETLSTALLQLLGPGHGVLHNLQVIRKTVARWPLQGQVTEGGGRDAWVSALRELLEDVDEGVRGAAAEALGYLVAKSTGEVILNLLAPVLRHAQPYVREAGLNVITAAHATDSASARERLKLIVPLLEATEATVRAAAIRAARRMLPFLDEPLIGRTGGRYHLVHPAGQLGQGYFGSVGDRETRWIELALL